VNSDSDLKLPAILDMPPRPTRRQSIQWVMAAVAASAVPSRLASAEPTVRPGSAAQMQKAANAGPGYGLDPDLLKTYQPGDLWPLTFNETQRRAATALADVIFPKDDLGPAASAVGVVELIDEWISAPYPQQQGDHPLILEALAWLDAESKKRFQKPFAELSTEQHHNLCDEICFPPSAKPEFRRAADCFNCFRGLAASAYYATAEGWKAIGYVGNVALEQFDGPPQEVLDQLGVTQTVR